MPKTLDEQFYGNKIVFITYTRLEKNLIGENVHDKHHHKLYNEHIIDFKL